MITPEVSQGPRAPLIQTEIQFFWPLTEQIPLDLDFSPSLAYEEEKRRQATLD